jgi:hypothetical protein
MTPTTEAARTETPRRYRLSLLELILGGAYVAVLLVLVALEPDILQAPFESTRAVVVTFGGAVLAVVAILVMMRLGVPPVVRVLVVGIPIVVASWWLLEPFFVDDEVQERFSTSIAAARREPESRTEPTATTSAPGGQAATPAPANTPTTAPAPTGPQLLGSGTFVGLAGHDGTGDAGIFRLEDGSHVVRLENLDIDNGPDLQLYLVPGSESYSPGDGSVHLGALKGNVGNQTYEIPADFDVTPGPWTVLVWCEAFTVEFVGATLDVA